MDKKLLKIKDSNAYSGKINEIITDLLQHLKNEQDNVNGEIKDLRDCLYKWSFESKTFNIYKTYI